MSIPQAVFLDTSVFDAQNYNYGSVALKAFIKVCQELHLTLLLPASTELELKRHIAARSDEIGTEFQKLADQVRRKAPFLQDWLGYKRLVAKTSPSLTFQRQIASDQAWAAFWEQVKVERLDYRGVDVAEVMRWYDKIRPPFGASAAKRKEFPDAITLQILLRYTDRTAKTIAVVSGDGDFKAACADRSSLLHFSSIAQLTEILLSRDARVIEYINLVSANQDQLSDQLLDELRDHTFRHVHRELSIESSNVQGVGIWKFDIIAIGEHECTISFDAQIEAEHEVAWEEFMQVAEDDLERFRRSSFVNELSFLQGTSKIRFTADNTALEGAVSFDYEPSNLDVEAAPNQR